MFSVPAFLHSIAILSLCLASCLEARYALSDDYNSANFFDKFEYSTAEDPTHGYVQYVDQSTARSTGLIKNTTLGGIYIGVDMTNTYDPTGPGRPSVRLQSLAKYNHGLFVLDLSHMPWGCGAWPAWWTVGDLTQWPKYGEIDIIEGVNANTNNTNEMYTSEGCTVSGTGELGTMDPLDCHGGCGLTAPDSMSYGAGFNSKQGGIYIMEWTSAYIRIWSFSHDNIPSSLSSGSPDPAQDFGVPVANFQGDCNIDEHFQDHQIVFDITWCGDWAGPTFQNYPSCPLTSGLSSWDSCKQYVATHPEELSEVYWAINNMRVYQTTTSLSSSASSSTSSLATAYPTTTTLTSSSISMANVAHISSSLSSISPSIPSTSSSSQSSATLSSALSATPTSIRSGTAPSIGSSESKPSSSLSSLSPSTPSPASSSPSFTSSSSATPTTQTSTYPKTPSTSTSLPSRTSSSQFAHSTTPSSPASPTSTTPIFTPAAIQPCSPIKTYLGPSTKHITGIGSVAVSQSLCQGNCTTLSGCTEYLFVHYAGDSSSASGYWDCWLGDIDAQDAVCSSSTSSSMGPTVAQTDTLRANQNDGRESDYQVYEQLQRSSDPSSSVLLAPSSAKPEAEVLALSSATGLERTPTRSTVVVLSTRTITSCPTPMTCTSGGDAVAEESGR